MTFDQALAQISACVPHLGGGERTPLRSIIVCSGGVIDRPDDAVPALLATRELAIRAWCDAMLAALCEIKDVAGYSFVDGPHCDQHVMTNQTQRNQQRVVEPRFSVTATVGLFLSN